MSTTQQLLADLDALDALFSDESKWIKGAFAMDADGLPRWWAGSDDTVAWCLSGGCERVSPHRFASIKDALLATISGTVGGIPGYNDDEARTFSDIKKLIADTRARVAAQQE